MGRKGKIYIGTSGWHYKHWIGSFYPQGTKDADQLSYYLKFFKTVELNNSFNGLPALEAFANWRKAVQADFVFAIKGSRYITHQKKLNIEKENISIFYNSVKRLREKAGPVLFQLPPHWNVNVERFARFLKLLPKKYRFTFEFRNHSWYNDEVDELLRRYNCAFCIYELEHHLSPLKVTADFVYTRLHGPGNKYQGSYTDTQLKKSAVQCKAWPKDGKNAYRYFVNDPLGYAAFNAKKLMELVK